MLFIKLKSILFCIVVILLVIPFFNIQAQGLGGDIMRNIGLAGGGISDPKVPLPIIIGNIIQGFLVLLGIIFLVLVLYAGFLWMTAGGNPEQAKKAGTTLRNAVIGLVIVLLSYAITFFVFDILLKAT